MEFGIALASNLDGWKTAKRAEELGFSHAWFYDTQMLRPPSLLAAASFASASAR
jgi:5,10-methylenetetrahydromethanopterin reductase